MNGRFFFILNMPGSNDPFADVEINIATPDDLNGFPGMGPELSARLLGERNRNGTFSNWVEMITRVRGIGPSNAAKLSNEGLRVNGEQFNED